MRKSSYLPVFIVLVVSLLLAVLCVVEAIPDLVVRITAPTTLLDNSLTVTNDGDEVPPVIEFFAKRAQFGSQNDLLEGTLILSPDYDLYLCEHFKFQFDVDIDGNITYATLPQYQKPPPPPTTTTETVMLVPRGECSFERKAYAAFTFYGAKGILIYDRLGARYRWNEMKNTVIYPTAKIDYECSNGYSSMHNLPPFDPPPYNENQFDPLMGMTTTSMIRTMPTPTLPTTTAESFDDLFLDSEIYNTEIDLSAEGIITAPENQNLANTNANANDDNSGDGFRGGGVGIDIDITTDTTTTSATPTTTDVCNLTGTTLQHCESQLCLITTRKENNNNNSSSSSSSSSSGDGHSDSDEYSVCCAWDTPVTMPFADDAKDMDTNDIVAAWLTIRQSEMIFQSGYVVSSSSSSSSSLFENKAAQAQISIKYRGTWSPFNFTYVFMWLWGSFVMAIGGWYAAGSYRTFNVQLTAYNESEEGKKEKDKKKTNRRQRRSRSNQPRTTNIEESIHVEDLESGDIFHNEIIMNDNGNGNGNGNRDEVPPPSTAAGSTLSSTARKETEKGKKQKMEKKNSKKKKMQKQEVWSLHSLPPPERKKKKNNKSKQRSTSASGTKNKSSTTNLSSSIAFQIDFTNTNTNTTNRSTNNEQQEETIIPTRESEPITSFEMTKWHVLGFVVFASLTLIILYKFKIYNIIFVFYGLGCARSISHLVFDPLVHTVVTKVGGNSWVQELKKPVCCGMNGFDVTSSLIAYIWAAVWLWYGITHYRPQTQALFWLTLNIFGACVCILGVTVLKLNSIKIATMLLGAIFLYDIFFVFITPFLTRDGTSVMIDVASGSSGANPSGEDHCNKYSNEKGCVGIGFLPMLFILPQINDYADGSIILGLGDIVLPGFLIAFCARHDEAARLIGAHYSSNDADTLRGIDIPIKWYDGYFFSMMIAYSIGLFLAFMAVVLMEQGQPALLYICPLCLGTIFFLGRNDLKELWNGGKVFRVADRLISKTERKWGKARMKRFAEQRRRENAAANYGYEAGDDDDDDDAIILPELGTPRNSNIQASEKNPSECHNIQQPVSKDVCFGYEGHPGTRFFRFVVKEVAADRDKNEEYKPEIYKLIKKKLKGRRYFKNAANNDDVTCSWTEASNLEIRKELGKAYDEAAREGRISSVLNVVEEFDPLTLPTL